MHPPRRAPQVRMRTLGTLLILFARLPTAAAVAFSNKADLKAALERWCANGQSTVVDDDAPNTWDVSAVTDMSNLMYTVAGSWTSACRAAFNEARAAQSRSLCLLGARPASPTSCAPC